MRMRIVTAALSVLLAGMALAAYAGTAQAVTATTYSEVACVFNAPSGAQIGGNTFGHVGWAFLLSFKNGLDTWEYGANEGPVNFPLNDISKTWHQTGSTNQMFRAFVNAMGISGNSTYYHAKGYYTNYRCGDFTTTNQSGVASAEAEVNHENNELYVIPGQDCEAQTNNVLLKYGYAHLPGDIRYPEPNTWYGMLGSYGFSAVFPIP